MADVVGQPTIVVRLLAAVRRRPLAAFFAITFAASWGYWIPVAVAGGHWSHFPGLLGPMVGAVVVTAATSGRAGLRDLGARMARWRVPPSCYGAVAVVVAAGLAAIGVQAVAGSGPSWRDIADMPGLPVIGWLPVFALALLINGFGEEAGWRGFAWGELRRRYSLGRAALLLALPWALWHAPTFWIDSGMRGFPPLMIPGFVIGLAAGAVVLGHLYERSGSSVFVVALWHTMLNMASATEGTADFSAAVVSTVVIFWAVRILRTNPAAAFGDAETAYAVSASPKREGGVPLNAWAACPHSPASPARRTPPAPR